MTSFPTIEISDPRFESDGLRFITAKSPALAGRVDVTVYVPERAKTAANVPVVILLHGVYGSHWAWALKGGAHRTAARMIEAGEIPPMILAMPSDGLWGDGSGYVRHHGRDFEHWIGTELPDLLAQTDLPVTLSSPFFISGLSMGGFGALRIGALNSGRFLAISAHSSVTHLDALRRFSDENVAAAAAPGDASALDAILANRDLLPALRVDCGLEDPLLEDNRALHAALDQHGIAHVYQEFPGGHDWPYWELHLQDTLRFFARGLVR